MKQFLQREAQIAFDKHAQPVVFRIAKYFVAGGVVFLFRNASYFWWLLGGLAAGGLLLHGFYRYKTRGWTQSYGWGLLRWSHEKVMRAAQRR